MSVIRCISHRSHVSIIKRFRSLHRELWNRLRVPMNFRIGSNPRNFRDIEIRHGGPCAANHIRGRDRGIRKAGLARRGRRVGLKHLSVQFLEIGHWPSVFEVRVDGFRITRSVHRPVCQNRDELVTVIERSASDADGRERRVLN